MFSNEASLPYLLQVEPITHVTMARVIGELRREITGALRRQRALGPQGLHRAGRGHRRPVRARDLHRRLRQRLRPVEHQLRRGDPPPAPHPRRDRCASSTTSSPRRPSTWRSATSPPSPGPPSSTPSRTRCASPASSPAPRPRRTRCAVVKAAVPDTPVFANTGLRVANVQAQLAIADGGIVGTTFKRDGYIWNEVDEGAGEGVHGSARVGRMAGWQLIGSEDMDKRWQTVGQPAVSIYFRPAVQPGERVMIAMGEIESLPLAEAVYAAAVKAGAYPQVQFLSETLRHSLLTAWQPGAAGLGAGDRGLRHGVGRCLLRPARRVQPAHARAIDAARLSLNQGAMGKVSTLRWQKTRWCLVRVPNAAFAYQAETDEETSPRCSSPPACWIGSRRAALWRGWADTAQPGRARAPRGQGDRPLVFDARTQMDGGRRQAQHARRRDRHRAAHETVDGQIYFEFPGVLGGRLMHDIRLRWERGRLVEATRQHEPGLPALHRWPPTPAPASSASSPWAPIPTSPASARTSCWTRRSAARSTSPWAAPTPSAAAPTSRPSTGTSSRTSARRARSTWTARSCSKREGSCL